MISGHVMLRCIGLACYVKVYRSYTEFLNADSESSHHLDHGELTLTTLERVAQAFTCDELAVKCGGVCMCDSTCSLMRRLK